MVQQESVCGMVVIHQALLIIGWYESPLKWPQQLSQYDDEGGLIAILPHINNDQHLRNIGTGEPRSAITWSLCVCLQDVCVRVVNCWKDGRWLRC